MLPLLRMLPPRPPTECRPGVDRPVGRAVDRSVYTAINRPVVLPVRLLSHQLRAAPDAVVAVDASGRVLDLNAVAERMFEQDRDAIVDQPLGELVSGLPAIPEIAEDTPGGADKAVCSARLCRRVPPSGDRRGSEEFPLKV